MSAVSAIAGTSAGCTVPLSIAHFVIKIAWFVLQLALDISNHIYTEIVDKKVNSAYSTDVTMSMYDNIITSFGNINTVFAATQQLKTILGNIADELDEDDENRRRMLIEEEDECVPTDKCCLGDCECTDPTKFCNCTNNYRYISGLLGGKFLFRLIYFLYPCMCALFFYFTNESPNLVLHPKLLQRAAMAKTPMAMASTTTARTDIHLNW